MSIAVILTLAATAAPPIAYLEARWSVGVKLTRQQVQGVAVHSVLPQGPAALAGLKAGDVITAVDGTPVDREDVSAATERIRGPRGTRVTLAIAGKGTVTIERALSPQDALLAWGSLDAQPKGPIIGAFDRLLGEATRGSAPAARALAEFYRQSNPDSEEVLWWLLVAARAGDINAAHETAAACLTGRGLPRNRALAIQLLTAQRDAQASLSLGRLAVASGMAGMPADLWKRLQAAADEEYPEALYLLGRLHLEGRGVPRNVALAEDLFRRGHAALWLSATLSLGRILEDRQAAAEARQLYVAAAGKTPDAHGEEADVYEGASAEWEDLGVRLARLQAPEEAKRAFHTADTPRALLQEAGLADSLESYRQAAESYLDELEDNSPLALLRVEKEREPGWAEAIALLRKAAKAGDPRAGFELLMFEAERDDWNPVALRSVAVRGSAAAWAALGLQAQAAGADDQALEAFRQATHVATRAVPPAVGKDADRWYREAHERIEDQDFARSADDSFWTGLDIGAVQSADEARRLLVQSGRLAGPPGIYGLIADRLPLTARQLYPMMLADLFWRRAQFALDQAARQRWLGLSAEYGGIAAELNLARLAEKKGDLTGAYTWYALAESDGSTEATAALDRLTGRLTPADTTKAQSRAFKLWEARRART